MSKYTFIFFTGNGIGEIWSHTVKSYPLIVNAENDDDAIKKILKMKASKSRYNDCFNEDVFGVERDKKLGVCFSKYNIIKWEGESVLRPPQVFGIMPYVTQITSSKYVDGNWACQNIFRSLYPTFEAYLQYVFEYMNHSAFGETAEQRLHKYYHPLLKEVDPLNKLEEKK